MSQVLRVIQNEPNFEWNESDLKNDPGLESDSSKPALENESEWIMIVRIKYV